jgi:hypothetical protein
MATNVLTNLPAPQSNDSASKTKLYFNQYGDSGQQFNAADVDATIGFLQNKGFGNQAATITAMVLLTQAKIDGLNVFSLLETLKGLETLQLSALVGQILNNNRSPTSSLGYRTAAVKNTYQERNIAA